MDISILLPTRGRADQMERSLRSLLDKASGLHKIDIVFGVDRDDQENTELWKQTVRPYLAEKNVSDRILLFEPMGYENLHHYLNALAGQSTGSWMFFWTDLAFMQTQDWDKIICSHTGQFKLLSVHTHNEHPYSIFPIIPRKWYDLVGHLSQHSLNDAWLSQIAYMLDIFERIPVWCDHDRCDLTGNNNDATFKNRKMLETDPANPNDFNYVDCLQQRLNDCVVLSTWMKNTNIDTSFFEESCLGKQDPWEKMFANDVNRQLTDLRRSDT